MKRPRKGVQVNGNGKSRAIEEEEEETPGESTSDAPIAGSSKPKPPHTPPHTPKPNGFLGPKSISPSDTIQSPSSAQPLRRKLRRRSSLGTVPGGRLNFVKFETDQIDECIAFISTLIESSSASHGVSVAQMKKFVQIMATGGGAHLYYEKLVQDLGVEVMREEEMDCLITGLTFIMEIPDEVFWYSDELVEAVSHRQSSKATATQRKEAIRSPSATTQTLPTPPEDLPRPSPNPPQYSLIFEQSPKPQFPCILVNIGSGVSIIKVDDYGKFERISGTSLGGGTLWGILSLLTGAESFDGMPTLSLDSLLHLRGLSDMLTLSEEGDNSTVDMLVGDICA